MHASIAFEQKASEIYNVEMSQHDAVISAQHTKTVDLLNQASEMALGDQKAILMEEATIGMQQQRINI